MKHVTTIAMPQRRVGTALKRLVNLLLIQVGKRSDLVGHFQIFHVVNCINAVSKQIEILLFPLDSIFVDSMGHFPTSWLIIVWLTFSSIVWGIAVELW